MVGPVGDNSNISYPQDMNSQAVPNTPASINASSISASISPKSVTVASSNNPALAIPVKESTYVDWLQFLSAVKQKMEKLRDLVQSTEFNRQQYFKTLIDQYSEGLQERIVDQEAINEQKALNETNRKTQNAANYQMSYNNSTFYNSTSIANINAQIQAYNTLNGTTLSELPLLPTLPPYIAPGGSTVQSPTDSEMNTLMNDFNTVATEINATMAQPPYDSFDPTWSDIPTPTFIPADTTNVFTSAAEEMAIYSQFMQSTIYNSTVSTSDLLKASGDQYNNSPINQILNSSVPINQLGTDASLINKKGIPGLYDFKKQDTPGNQDNTPLSQLQEALFGANFQQRAAADIEEAKIIGGVKSLIAYIEQKEKVAPAEGEEEPLTLQGAFNASSSINSSLNTDLQIKQLAAVQVADELLATSKAPLDAALLAELSAITGEQNGALFNAAADSAAMIKQMGYSLIAAYLLTGGNLTSLLPKLQAEQTSLNGRSPLSTAIANNQDQLLSAAISKLLAKGIALGSDLSQIAKMTSTGATLDLSLPLSDSELQQLLSNLLSGGSLTKGLSGQAQTALKNALVEKGLLSADQSLSQGLSQNASYLLQQTANQFALSGQAETSPAMAQNLQQAGLLSASPLLPLNIGNQDLLQLRENLNRGLSGSALTAGLSSSGVEKVQSLLAKEMSNQATSPLSAQDSQQLLANLLAGNSQLAGLSSNGASLIAALNQSSQVSLSVNSDVAAFLANVLEGKSNAALAQGLSSQGVNLVNQMLSKGAASAILSASDVAKLSNNILSGNSLPQDLSPQSSQFISLLAKTAGKQDAALSSDAAALLKGQLGGSSYGDIHSSLSTQGQAVLLASIAASEPQTVGQATAALKETLDRELAQRALTDEIAKPTAYSSGLNLSLNPADLKQLALNLGQGNSNGLEGLSNLGIANLKLNLTQAGLIKEENSKEAGLSSLDRAVQNLKELSIQFDDEQFATKVIEEFDAYQKENRELGQFLIDLLSPSMFFIKEFSMQTASQKNSNPVIGP